MANTTINGLTTRTPAATDEIPINQAGADGKITVAGIQTPWLQSVAAGAFSLTFDEMAAPSNPASNKGTLFVRDNGSGKSQLCIIFASGSVINIATEV